MAKKNKKQLIFKLTAKQNKNYNLLNLHAELIPLIITR
jgi:hypothetical protein